jgi:hypothetical protein
MRILLTPPNQEAHVQPLHRGVARGRAKGWMPVWRVDLASRVAVLLGLPVRIHSILERIPRDTSEGLDRLFPQPMGRPLPH